MKIDYLQLFFKSAYDYSCYVDCLIKLACKINKVDHNLTNIGKYLDIGFDKKFITFNKNDYTAYENFTVVKAEEFLSAITEKKFIKEFKDRNYSVKNKEYEIQFWTKSEENGKRGIGHFVLPDYDPLKNSQTKKVGFIYSKRVFREI